MTEQLYIIDLLSLVFQVYHAIPAMTGPRGEPTNAVFGFARDLRNLLRDKRPDYLICAMDSSGPGERNGLYSEYKANRAEMPADLVSQIPLILDVIRGFNVPLIEHPGWEADDVLATVARQAVERGIDVVIVTNDKDARQLIGPKVRLFNVRKNTLLDEQALLQDWGVRPDQVIDFQAMVGDSVDNVPGIPLVGPKKARDLLQKYGTLEEVLAHADEAPGAKLRENLKTFAERARVSRQLVALNTDLPLEVDWEAARVSEPDRERLRQLFTDLGFRQLTEEFSDSREVSTGVAEFARIRGKSNSPNSCESGYGGGQPREQSPISCEFGYAAGAERTWEIVDTSAKFERFLAALKQQKKFCLDLETTSLDAVRADIVGWAFSWRANHGIYIPVDGPNGQNCCDSTTIREALRPVLEDPQVEVVNQNIKYDMLVLRRAGIRLQRIGMDPMVGDYLLDAGARSHGLDSLAARYLKHRMIPISDLIGNGKKQKQMFEVDIDRAAQYAAEDADIAWQLAEIIGEKLRQEGLWDLYWDLERPLIAVLAEMEFTGIKVDVEELRRQSVAIGERLKRLVGDVYELAGREFNIDSPIQLRDILFVDLKLPISKRTKTGASTNQEVLERLALLHPLPAKVLEHRQLAKLKGTYLDALPLMVNPETGRIHASFNQVVAATGRLSSSDPNLQNIPVRTEEGRLIRKAFIPSQPGWKLVCADYSQIELRMLAHFSGDPALATAFLEGTDIHTAVAAQVFGVPAAAVDSAMRRVAKAVNFGVIYGQSPFGLSQALRISQGQAAEFIENYFARYAGVDRYFEQLLTEVSRTGYATTILGRRRQITGIQSTTGRQRNLPERTAINTVIQGSAADLIKRAMINIHRRLQGENSPARLLLQIHDELVFEVPAAEVDSLVTLVCEEMQSALELVVPLVVDVKVGENWLDVQPV